ncbi:Similar to S.cerevisiae protein SBH2 (Ssh1p-Sss1p-Sbh2p complex component) [Malassezia sympodialis ATCC 42132]|uniref:Protein transport protein Sec61 subunit beta n=1 Tax=Malassezia sympodialis (strain ATCC 42132) TaxID=1230383 RepID=A0A1M8A0H0_MALS4|nr:Similar to S.cerevisiae protein SBH2 (Ssh1p-Sss1p-Sbh2p complex component) [Malassezia sympodialis ATCC 42132]
MSEKSTHKPLTQAQLAALASRNSSVMRRKAALAEKNKPHSTREAGAGGSSNTMLRLYTDDNKGLTVDPVIVLVLSVAFVLSVVLLHILGKVARYFTK